MNLEIFEVVPAGSEGHSRGTCESCGLHLWSAGGYHVPGLKWLFCSLLCIECGVAEKTGRRKQIPGAPIGSGARLLVYLKTVAPALYAKFAGQIVPSDKKRCIECDIPPRWKAGRLRILLTCPPEALHEVLDSAKARIYRGNAHRKTRTYGCAKWRIDEYPYPATSGARNGCFRRAELRTGARLMSTIGRHRERMRRRRSLTRLRTNDAEQAESPFEKGQR